MLLCKRSCAGSLFTRTSSGAGRPRSQGPEESGSGRPQGDKSKVARPGWEETPSGGGGAEKQVSENKWCSDA